MSEDVPRAEVVPVRRGWRRPSLLWLLPFAAIGAVAAVVYQVRQERGPIVAVEFRSGEGIRPGDPVIYRGVRIGEVLDVALAPDLAGVMVRAELRRDAEGVAREGSRFWIVRPELSLTRVAGLETILGPRYIEVEPGDGAPTSRFAGLDLPPLIDASRAAPGLRIVAQSDRLGAVSVGSAVTYRGIRVGRVTDVALAGDARFVDVSLEIEPRYRDLVRVNSRFFKVGAIGVDWGIMSGFSLKAASIESIVGGEVGFATPEKMGEPAPQGHRFVLEAKAEDDWLKWSPAIALPPPPDSRPGGNGTRVSGRK